MSVWLGKGELSFLWDGRDSIWLELRTKDMLLEMIKMNGFVEGKEERGEVYDFLKIKRNGSRCKNSNYICQRHWEREWVEAGSTIQSIQNSNK